jgi:hypothetical protein
MRLNVWFEILEDDSIMSDSDGVLTGVGKTRTVGLKYKAKAIHRDF